MEKDKILNKFNIAECVIVFLSILLKYLIIHGISKKILYIYLGVLIIFTIAVLLKKKFKKKEIIKISAMMCISLYFVLFYVDVNFFISLLLAIVCVRKENKDFIKIFFITSILLYCGNIILNLAGIVPSNNMIRNVETGTIIRYDLGFGHPNAVFLFLLPIIFSGYYLFNQKKTFYIVSILISILFFNISNCRTGIGCVILMLALGWLQSFKGMFRKNNLLPNVFFIYTLISIFVAWKFGGDIKNIANNILSNRPYYWNLYIENDMMFSLFGHNMNKIWYVDNFYLYLLIELGIVGFLIYDLLYYFSIKKIKNDYKLSLILLIFLTYGLFETNVIIGSIQFAFAIQLKYLIQNEDVKFNKDG